MLPGAAGRPLLTRRRPPPCPAPRPQVLAAELGVAPTVVFSNISPEPVAAASLGQVRKRGRAAAAPWPALPPFCRKPGPPAPRAPA
jgi:hypothetical protein